MKTTNQSLLGEVADRLANELHPEGIWLLGSHASGTPDKGCDLYLMDDTKRQWVRSSLTKAHNDLPQFAPKCLTRLSSVPRSVEVVPAPHGFSSISPALKPCDRVSVSSAKAAAFALPILSRLPIPSTAGGLNQYQGGGFEESIGAQHRGLVRTVARWTQQISQRGVR